MSIKFLLLGGGGILCFGGGGGSADFIFMGARIFLKRAVRIDLSSANCSAKSHSLKTVTSLNNPERQKLTN